MLKPALLLVAATVSLSAVSSAHAMFSGETPDNYTRIEDGRILKAYQDALATEGHSSTGDLYAFRAVNVKKSAETTRGTVPHGNLVVHAVQDRGLPRGTEFPTYVFITSGNPESAELIFKAHAGKRLYVAESSDRSSGCLLSAEKGWSDICLADLQGKAAPGLPGLRKDFWSDLLKIFGL